MALILASSSPRRVELLRAAGFDFTSQSPNVPEVHIPGETPDKYSSRLAVAKAEAVWKGVKAENTFVIAADTIVVVDDQILEKPLDARDAERMLRLISGRTHRVTTSVCLMGRKKHGSAMVRDTRTENTLVHVSPLSAEEIRDYIAHGEPMDKAGGYAIQGIASRWITRIEGCYFNVVGLPIPLLYCMLREHGAV